MMIRQVSAIAIASLLLLSLSHAQSNVPSAKLPPNADPKKPAKQINVTPSGTFLLKSSMSQTIMIALGVTSVGEKADLKLQFKAGESVFLAMKDGKWKTLGPGGTSVRASGKDASLRKTSFEDGNVIWKFGHSLEPGKSCTVFQKSGDLWVRVAMVNCRKTE